MNKDDVSIEKEEIAYDGFMSIKSLLIRHKLFKGGWSPNLHRELVVRREAAAVLPYDPCKDCVVLIEQFRIGALKDEVSPWMVEIVAGLSEPGESVESLVKREAVEEAGLQLDALEPISKYWSSPGGSSERVSLFCGKVDASGAGGIHGLEGEGEDIKVSVVNADEAYGWVEQGKIRNAMTIIALQWLKINKEKLLKKWPSSS